MEARFYKKLKQQTVICESCQHFCTLLPGEFGKCGVRQNQNGKLISLVYGRVSALGIDPIEKKPFYHFLPGSFAYSFGTIGCNFACLFCQNWQLSQVSKKNPPLFEGVQEERIKLALKEARNLTPKEIVSEAQRFNCQSIAYTYNEPTVFSEFALETAQEAKKAGLKNLWVSNGFFSERVLKEVINLVDAINIDLKSFKDPTYQEVSRARLEPVLKNISALKKAGVWVEVTTLLIPSLNDSSQELKEIAQFLVDISPEIPWHLSAYWPAYLASWPATSLEDLEKAYKIGKKAGLYYVYIGNLPSEKENTYCPNCQKLLIRREGYFIWENHLSANKCPFCQTKIAGVWRKDSK